MEGTEDLSGTPSVPGVEGAAREREWIVYCSSTHTQVFVGIKAASRDEAISAFYGGRGEISPDRERWSEWNLDAVDVKDV